MRDTLTVNIHLLDVGKRTFLSVMVKVGRQRASSSAPL
jgi:hypothetical protein